MKSQLECEHQQKGSEKCSTVLEISQAEGMTAGSSPQRGEYTTTWLPSLKILGNQEVWGY